MSERFLKPSMGTSLWYSGRLLHGRIPQPFSRGRGHSSRRIS